jgi:nucleosome binding factor SPN SPT16 subunit
MSSSTHQSSKLVKKEKVSSTSNAKSPAKTRNSAVGGKVLANKTRGAQREQIDATTAQRIKTHQIELHAAKKAEGLKKWEDGTGAKDGGAGKVVKKYESYKREEQIPRSAEDRRVGLYVVELMTGLRR